MPWTGIETRDAKPETTWTRRRKHPLPLIVQLIHSFTRSLYSGTHSFSHQPARSARHWAGQGFLRSALRRSPIGCGGRTEHSTATPRNGTDAADRGRAGTPPAPPAPPRPAPCPCPLASPAVGAAGAGACCFRSLSLALAAHPSSCPTLPWLCPSENDPPSCCLQRAAAASGSRTPPTPVWDQEYALPALPGACFPTFLRTARQRLGARRVRATRADVL